MSTKSSVIDAEPTFLDNLIDFNGPDDSELWVGRYPVIQWNNKVKKWEFSLKHWAGSYIEEKNDLTEIDHDLETEHGFLLDTIHVSVVAWRAIWEHKGVDDKMVYSAQPDWSDGQKWTKRFNFLCLVRETGDEKPAIITASGFTGEFLQNAITQGRERTLKMVRNLTGRQLPGYLFWIPLAAGEKRIVGKEKKSAIFPPVPIAYDIAGLNKSDLIVLLESIYVGDEIKELIVDSLYEDGQQWIVEKNNALALSAASGNILNQEAPIIEVLPGGAGLYIPDLSKGTKGDWFECALSVPDLFENRGEVNRVFMGVIRAKGLGGPPDDQQWEAWREEIERRWADKILKDEEITRELEMRNGG